MPGTAQAAAMPAPPEPAVVSYALFVDGREMLRVETGAEMRVGANQEGGRQREAFADHGNVSRLHCVVRGVAEGLLVNDANSTNGTFVDGRRLAGGEPAIIAPGGSFRLAADCTVLVRHAGADAVETRHG